MIAAILLFVLVVVTRVAAPLMVQGDASAWANFSPLAALALCGGAFFPRRLAYALPLGALLISDLILNAHYGAPLVTFEMAVRYGVFALVIALGFALRSNPSLGRLVAGSLVASVAFYLVTNTASWAASAVYAKSLPGWLQALWTGEPGYPPTWTFFRNTLAGDLLYTALFWACMKVAARPAADRDETAVASRIAR